MVLHAMEIAGWVKINKDESGKPLGFIFELHTTSRRVEGFCQLSDQQCGTGESPSSERLLMPALALP
jgi:hypothetical protein